MRLNIQTANTRSVLFEQQLNAVFVLNLKLGIILRKGFGQPLRHICVCSQNCEKSLLASWCTRISARQRATTFFSLYGFS
jgi:hypothetical protein